MATANTIPERIKALETLQAEHEKANNLALYNLSNRIEEVNAVANEAKEMAAQTNVLVMKMPEEIRKTIREENKGKRIEIRDWIIGAAVIAGPVIAVLMAKG